MAFVVSNEPRRHEPFDWGKEYMELMDDAWEEARRYMTAEQQETEDEEDDDEIDEYYYSSLFDDYE